MLSSIYVFYSVTVEACEYNRPLFYNSKRLIMLLQLLLKLGPNRALVWIKKRPQWVCSCCGAKMQIIATRLPSLFTYTTPQPTWWLDWDTDHVNANLWNREDPKRYFQERLITSQSTGLFNKRFRLWFVPHTI